MCQPWSWISAGKGWYELLARQGSEKHSTMPSFICKEKHIQCRVVVKQHRMQNPWHNGWIGKVPPLLFCQRSIHNHRPQTISSNELAKSLQHCHSGYNASCFTSTSTACIYYTSLVSTYIQQIGCPVTATHKTGATK